LEEVLSIFHVTGFALLSSQTDIIIVKEVSIDDNSYQAEKTSGAR
jgi:hypothetical protein